MSIYSVALKMLSFEKFCWDSLYVSEAYVHQKHKGESVLLAASRLIPHGTSLLAKESCHFQSFGMSLWKLVFNVPRELSIVQNELSWHIMDASFMAHSWAFSCLNLQRKVTKRESKHCFFSESQEKGGFAIVIFLKLKVSFWSPLVFGGF